MRDVTVIVRDVHDDRAAVVDTRTLDYELESWFGDDQPGTTTARPRSASVRRLANALQNGSWAAVHAAADALAVSVTVLGEAR